MAQRNKVNQTSVVHVDRIKTVTKSKIFKYYEGLVFDFDFIFLYISVRNRCQHFIFFIINHVV